MSRSKSLVDDAKQKASSVVKKRKSQSKADAARGMRETIESIVIAIILAFLFRAFEAEAFVIPTGSMAPTLQGRHLDVFCEQCGHQYRSGASSENSDNQRPRLVLQTTCPICRYSMVLNRPERLPEGQTANPDHSSFMGDRILVSKFAYELSDPRRWDVIVFKFPENAKQNYIKRLIGLPGETVMIKHGNIFVKKDGETEFKIARKPSYKVKAMLQLVDDTDFVAPKLIAAGWPSRWQQWSVDEAQSDWSYQYNDTKQSFSVDLAEPANDHDRAAGQPAGAAANSQGVAWLRYRHLVPRWNNDFQQNKADWDDLVNGRLPLDLASRRGELISDFYAYNFNSDEGNYLEHRGNHWVGDLGLECDLEVKSESGAVLFDLVEGGVHYTCRIDVSNGQTALSIDNRTTDNRTADNLRGSFVDESAGETFSVCLAKSVVNQPGRYQVRFSNVDDELRLWINDHLVKFDRPTTYDPAGSEVPRWSETNPGDAEPIGIGCDRAAIGVHRLRVLRDVYYVATREPYPGGRQLGTDYPSRHGIDKPENIRQTMENPDRWNEDGNEDGLFTNRESRVFPALLEDQFLPMGDNSPASSDARYWREPFVERYLLTGKALFIYWPHNWNTPIPWTPNFSQRFIR